VDNALKRQLDNLLLMYNLMCTVHFSARINHSTASAIDNIIFDISQFVNYSVNPLTNDLSDHDAQILTLQIPVHRHSERLQFIKKIDKHTIPDFIFKLRT